MCVCMCVYVCVLQPLFQAFDTAALLDVFEAQARAALEDKDYARAEAFFVKARKPELAVQMYKDLKYVV